MTKIIGKIGFTPKDEFVPGHPYEEFDVVSYEGGSYVSRINENTALPTDASKWFKQSERGAKGDPGEKGDKLKFVDLTPEEKLELKGNVVLYNSMTEAEKNELAGRVPAVGKVQSGDALAVSGDQVSKSTLIKAETLDGINTYDYTKDIDGFYINSISGILVPSATSSVSFTYSVKPNQLVFLKNRTGERGFRFIDYSGNPLKPLNADGSEMASYSVLLNGVFKAPETAVRFQFTSKFNGTTNKDNIIVLLDVDTDVVKIKEELIPVTKYDIDSRELAESANNKINPIIGDAIPNRINTGEASENPSMFPTFPNITSSFGIEVLNDTESPTASIIGKKRRFYNNTVADKSASYRTYAIPLNENRPDKISVSWRAKRIELTNIFIGNTYVDFSSGRFQFQFPSLLSGDIINLAITPTLNEYSSAKLRAKIIEEENGWVRIEYLFHEIIWKSTFTGSTINYLFMFNQANFYQKTLDVVDFTVLFNNEVEKGIVYGSTGEFPSNIITLKGINENVIELQNNLPNNKLRIELNNNNIYIGSSYSNDRNIVKRITVKRDSTFSNNPNVNLHTEYLVANGADLKNPLLVLKTSTDDICPANLNGGYIGGNHAWMQARILRLNNHGKTLADVGSIYKKASGIEFVILRIVDENSFWIVSRNQATDGFSYSFSGVSGDLEYVSNGVNTATITGYSSSSLSSAFTTSSVSEVSILIDDNVIAKDGNYKGNNVKIIESYYVYDLPSIIENIINNRPVGGYAENPMLNSFNALKLFKHSIVYEVQENGCMIITTNFRTYNKKINYNFHGFTQAIELNSGNIYVPKTLPYTIGSKIYNFNLIEDWNTDPTEAIHLISTYWENPTSPPDRIVNMNTNVSLHIGYLTDRGVGFNRKDKVNDAIFLNSTRKLYPMGDSVSRVMHENTSLNCVVFRDFQNPANNPIGRTSITQFEIGNEYFVYLDYHNSLLDLIEIPRKYIGCKIEIFEKVGNVELITDVVNGKIEVQSNVTTGNYGFLILKIK